MGLFALSVSGEPGPAWAVNSCDLGLDRVGNHELGDHGLRTGLAAETPGGAGLAHAVGDGLRGGDDAGRIGEYERHLPAGGRLPRPVITFTINGFWSGSPTTPTWLSPSTLESDDHRRREDRAGAGRHRRPVRQKGREGGTGWHEGTW